MADFHADPSFSETLWLRQTLTLITANFYFGYSKVVVLTRQRSSSWASTTLSASAISRIIQSRIR